MKRENDKLSGNSYGNSSNSHSGPNASKKGRYENSKHSNEKENSGHEKRDQSKLMDDGKKSNKFAAVSLS